MDNSKELMKEARKISRVIEEFRKIHPSINGNAILAFITIATHPNITVGKVQEALGLNSSTTARQVGRLSEWHRGGDRGLNLISSKEDFRDRRTKLLNLKPRGKRLWTAVSEHLMEDSHGQVHTVRPEEGGE